MWNNFCAVIVDLFWFAVSGLQPTSTPATFQTGGETYRLPSQIAWPRLAASAPVVSSQPPVNSNLVSTLKSHTHVLETAVIPLPAKTSQTVDDTAAILHAPVVMYVVAPLGTACVHSPQIDFDAVIETLPYGTAVTVIGYKGRFASVNRSNITGWVLKDDITRQKNDVWPTFVSGVVYDAEHPETLKTRLLIKDTFGAGILALPLQAGEYISVRLKSEHRTIEWTRKRPRLAGSWAGLLRGSSGIHSGVSPKTDTIMEYKSEEDEGRLGYVEAVAPDLAITMSAVGEGEAGRYSVKTMSAEIWRELRPIFIEVA